MKQIIKEIIAAVHSFCTLM